MENLNTGFLAFRGPVTLPIMSTTNAGSIVELNSPLSDSPFLGINQKETPELEVVRELFQNGKIGEVGEVGVGETEQLQVTEPEQGNTIIRPVSVPGKDAETSTQLNSTSSPNSSSSAPPSASRYKKNKGGRPRDPIANAILEAAYPNTNDENEAKQTRCSHCREWTQPARSAPRARIHAAFECSEVTNSLRLKSVQRILKTALVGSPLKRRASRRLKELGEDKSNEKPKSKELCVDSSSSEMDRRTLMKLGDLMEKYFPPKSKVGALWVEQVEQHLDIMKKTCDVQW